MAIAAAGGNDFVNLAFAPYNVSPSASAAANTAALIQAVTDHRRSATQPGRKLYVPGNSSAYPFNLTQPTSPFSLIGDGFGSTVFNVAAVQFLIAQAFRWRTSMSGSGRQTISTTISPGDSVLTGIASTAGWSAGQMLYIASPSVNVPGTNSGCFMGEWVRIKSVDSSTQLTLWGVVEETYSNGTQCYVTAQSPWNGCVFEGWTANNTAPGTAPNSADDQVVLRGLINSRCDIESIGGDNSSVMIDTCFDSDFVCRTRDGEDLNNNTPELDGYGTLLWNGCQNCIITVHARRHRHGLTTGGEAMGIPRHCKIRGTVQECTGSSIDTHAEGKRLIIEEVNISRSSVTGYSSDMSAGIQLRAPHTLIKGGEIYGAHGWAIEGGSSSASDCEIDGLHIDTIYTHPLDSTAGGIRASGARTVVRSCTIMGTTGAALQMEADGQTTHGNIFRRTTGSATFPINATVAATAGLVKNNCARGGYASMVGGTTAGITEVDSTVLT